MVGPRSFPVFAEMIVGFVGLLPIAHASEIFSPKPLTPLFVRESNRSAFLPVEIRGCGSFSELRIQADADSRVELRPFRRLPWGNRWDGGATLHWTINPVKSGRSVLTAVHFEFRCDGRIARHRVNLRLTAWSALSRVTNGVVSSFIERHPAASLDWSWGEGVLLWSLFRRQEGDLSPARVPVLSYLDGYFDRYRRRSPPKIQRPDSVPPALTAQALSKMPGREWMRALADPAYNYLKHERRTGPYETLNHLGETTLLRYFYPRSVWLDSLMMYALPAAVMGSERNDPVLESWATAQPDAFSRLLEDPADHLYRHGWFVTANEARPEGRVYWLRGNGWVAAALSEIARRSDSSARRDHLNRLVEKLWRAATPYRLPSGLWGSLLIEPQQSFAEVSGTAMLALGGVESVRSSQDQERLLETAQGIASRFAVLRDSESAPRYSVSEISSHTNVSGRLGYQLVAQRRDLPYGVGAVVLYFHELERAFHGWKSLKSSAPGEAFVGEP